jgi:hypothetical protein
MSDYGNPPRDPNQPNPYGAAQHPSGGPSASPQKGFFGALFDFKFDHFITPIIVKVVYVLALVGLVIGWLIFLLATFSQSTGGGLAVLVLGPIAMVIYLAFIRMTLEFYLAIVRLSEDVHHRGAL